MSALVAGEASWLHVLIVGLLCLAFTAWRIWDERRGSR